MSFCCYFANQVASFIFINMSSSELTGNVSDSFALLDASEYLDLSYNNLTGEVPDFLGNLTSLKVLNLTGNNFTGSIPSSLLRKSEEGSLILRFTNHTIPSNTGSKKKINTLIIVVICCAVLGLLLILILAGWFIWLRKRGKGNTIEEKLSLILLSIFVLISVTSSCSLFLSKVLVASNVTRHTEATIAQKAEHEPHPQVDGGKFTFNHLQVITNNFAQVIGKGAFGTFYLGYLDNVTRVAIKVHSQSTLQQAQEFEFEARQLLRIHHRNLVSLLGYCRDETFLALVYEYMPQGSLKDHLQGRDNLSRTLSWRERLMIALEAAQGLVYLHRGCLPPIIHRDLKISNILLGEKLEAKLTDYGMSKSFSNNTDVTGLEMVGTPGYTDPEFHKTYQLTEKSDIYSFGVVLLELITGRRAIQSGRSKVHIVQYMASYIAAGNIDAVVDKRFHGSFSGDSIRSVTDLAMQCTADTSADRPTIVDVVNRLKACIELEAMSETGTDQNVEGERSIQFSALEVEGSNHHLGPR